MRRMNKCLSVILAIVMVAGVIHTAQLSGLGLPGIFVEARAENADDGDQSTTVKIVCFGQYPQALVTDEQLLEKLNLLPLDWTVYEYYSGRGSNYTAERSDYMFFSDVDYNGQCYRAVRFDGYRSMPTNRPTTAEHSYQDDNGYFANTVYWFRYEPIKWIVLDEESGLILSLYSVDSQPFNNQNPPFGRINGGLVNNWEISGLRQWIGGTFYETAFSEAEKAMIQTSLIANNGIGGTYNYQDTNDKVFLLSYEDVTTSYSDLFSNHQILIASGTEYAKSQGLQIFDTNSSIWYLRSPVSNTHYGVSGVYADGALAENGIGIDYSCIGTRPAINIDANLLQDLLNCESGEHVFSDWITTEQAGIFHSGSRERSCTVCGYTEKELINKTEIDINENPNYGLANLTVVNAQTLQPIGGATVTISTDTDGTGTFTTDAEGNISVILPVCKQTVSVYCGSYQTRNINFTIRPGINDLPSIGLSEYGIVDASITVTEMSYDEIVSAGIDVEAPANTHVFKYEVTLPYDPSIDFPSIAFYFNSEGKCVGGEAESSELPTGGFGTLPAYQAGEGYAIKLPDDTVVYAASEKMLLVIRGEAKWLKEMFDVEMIIMNNSLTDTIENCTATLDLPEGMSLAAMSEGEQNLTQTVEHIDEGACASVHWYLCGDEEGDYTIGATLEGTTMPFEEDFSSYFEADSAIHVYAGSAFALTFEVPDVTYYNEDAIIRITLENVSDRTIYNVTHSVEYLKQCRVTYVSDGNVDEETYSEASKLGYITIHEMDPGDKLVIELSANIMFDSQALKDMLENWIGAVDDIEKFCNLFDIAQKLADTVYNLFSALVTTFTSAVESLIALDDIETLDEAKHNAVKELTSTLTRFMGVFSSNDVDEIVLANKVVNSKAYSELIKFTDEDNEDMFTPINYWVETKDAAEILDIAGYLSTILVNAVGQDGKDKKKSFDIFDSIRTAIRAIPIYYVLAREECYATTLSGSTTEIPITITAYDNGKPQYFGVSDMSKYIYSLGIAAVGKVGVPGVFGMLGGFDAGDITGYDDAVEYIKATEAEIARVQAVSATGDVSFSAYVVKKETPSKSNKQTKMKASADDIDNYFTLSCDNDTAVYENGVLSFSGGGIIEIIPLSTSDGTLYIEDSNGNVFTYEIEVVPQHECDAEKTVTILTPTKTTNGYIAKCCSICGDVLDIEEITPCDEHTFGAWETVHEGSCVEVCVKSRKCSVCGYSETETAGFSGHSYGEWTVVKAPTCTTGGTEQRVCARDASHTETRTIDATGHRWGAWEVVAAPSCTQTGLEERVCANDASHVETREIAKTGHTDADGDGLCDDCGARVGGGSSEQQSNCACGQYHTGFFAPIIKFFHSIIYFFKNIFK